METNGWVEVICGCMFSGKTEELIRRVRRAVIAKQKVQIFKPRLDTRSGIETVATHDGLSLVAMPVESVEDMAKKIDPATQVVAIDEAQFFDPSIVDLCAALARRGIRVIVAGLDLDFRGKSFEPVPSLMAQAELVDKLQAVCVVCGAPASFTQRLVNGQPAPYDSPVIVVGAQELYQARCRQCHEVPRER